jgi:hypothetical protein
MDGTLNDLAGENSDNKYPKVERWSELPITKRIEKVKQ